MLQSYIFYNKNLKINNNEVKLNQNPIFVVLIYITMEEWQIDFEWLKVRHYVKEGTKSKELPELKVILFLIGVQELGIIRTDFNKEEKQDLMHVAVATLLEDKEYFAFEGRDEDGWPHWKKLKPLDIDGVKEQELLLKKQIISYFEKDLTEISVD